MLAHDATVCWPRISSDRMMEMEHILQHHKGRRFCAWAAPQVQANRMRRSVMNRAQRIVFTGVGAMTPAFIAGDAAHARTVAAAAIEPVASGATILLDQEVLKAALLALSPTEKLRIAGDRIRLAAKTQNP